MGDALTAVEAGQADGVPPAERSTEPGDAPPSPLAAELVATERTPAFDATWALLALAGILGALLYHRVQRHRALELATRRRIHDAIAAHPGIRAGTLQRTLGINYSTVRHHVQILQDCGLVVARGEAQRRLYVPGTVQPTLVDGLVAASSPVASRIVAHLARHGETDFASLVEALGLPKSSASMAALRLARAGVLSKERLGGRLRLRLRVQPLPATFAEPADASTAHSRALVARTSSGSSP